MKLPPLVYLLAIFWALNSPLGAAQTPKPIAHWKLDAAHFDKDHFSAIAGDWNLPVSTPPQFLGEGARAALQFGDGTAGLVIDPKCAPSTLPKRKITIAAWVAIDKTTPWGGLLGAVEDNGNYERGWLLGTRNDRFTIALASEDHDRLVYLQSNQPLRLGTWQHVAGTYDGKSLRLYVDGKMVGESKRPGGDILYHQAHQFVLGAYKDKNENFPLTGALHEVRLYDRCLSKSQVARLAKNRDLLPIIGEESASGVKLRPELAELQDKIHLAIEGGEDFLLNSQYRNGAWSYRGDAFPNGLTALCVYALLESGLPADHPSIQGGLYYLKQRLPRKTYSAGLQLLAFAEAGDPSLVPMAEDIVQLLLDWENSSHPGSWGYPSGRPDVSNTQFAALGFWAAHKMGIEIPVKTWRRMVDTTVDRCMKGIQKVPNETKGTGAAMRKIGGFAYHLDDTHYPAFGGMTAAGIGILALAKQTCPNIGGKATRKIEMANSMALGWLDHYWRVDINPGFPESLYYYLYGLERVGSLLGIEKIGKHAWYAEGAAVLVNNQAENGRWPYSAGGLAKGRNDAVNTAFALLFLNRATSAVTTSGETRKASPDFHRLETGSVRLIASGKEKLSIWIDELMLPGEPMIQSVEYRLDDQRIVLLDQNPDSTNRWAYRHNVKKLGVHNISAWVTLKDGTVLKSDPLSITFVRTPKAFQSAALAHARPSRWASVSVTAKASSLRNAKSGAKLMIDHRQDTAWLCGADDKSPWLRLDISPPLKAKSVLLSPADANLHQLNRCDSIQRVKVFVNRKEVAIVDFPLDPLAEVLIPLGKRTSVSRLEIQIISRTAGKTLAGHTGFAEITLLED